MSPLINLDTDESLRWSTGLERISAAKSVIAEWGRTGRCGGAGRVAESWQHCVEIWVERDAGCSGLRGPSCRAVSHVACAPAVAPSVATCGGDGMYGTVADAHPRSAPVRDGRGRGIAPSWCGADASSEATRSGHWRSRMLIPRFELTLHARLLRPAPASCALWPWLLLAPASWDLAEWLCVRGSRNHGRNTEVTRDTTGSVKTTRRVARLETVSVSSFLKSYALYLERTRTDVCFAPTTLNYTPTTVR